MREVLLVLFGSALAACGQNNAELEMVRSSCLKGGATASECDCAVSRTRSQGVNTSSQEAFSNQATRNITECMYRARWGR